MHNRHGAVRPWRPRHTIADKRGPDGRQALPGECIMERRRASQNRTAWSVFTGWNVCFACFLLCNAARPASAQDTTVVTAGKEFAASPRVERWFGKGYRVVWTTPFAA